MKMIISTSVITYLKHCFHQKKLDNLVESAGYDTCHRIKDYDVDECHQDCIKQEQGEFAEKCRQDGGLYKTM